MDFHRTFLHNLELTEEQMRGGGDPSLGMCKTQVTVERNSAPP